MKYLLLVAGVSLSSALAQAPAFLAPTVQANGEVTLRLTGQTGVNYQIQASADGTEWVPFVTVPGRASNTHLDSAAPYFARRIFRALEVGTNTLTGDHLLTDEGEVTVRPVNHASFVMSWNGQTIYNDPVGGGAPYREFPKGDLILVSHSHGDHYDPATLNAVVETNGLIVVPPSIYGSMSTTLRAKAVSLANGASTNLLGVTIEAVPAYNANHSRGSGNGYVLTIGGTRFYVSGDTGDTPEMRALADIDVAFMCMNLPFTMSVSSAAGAARAFKPRVLYPYHYRNQGGALSDLNELKRLIGREDEIEVRVRNWY